MKEVIQQFLIGFGGLSLVVLAGAAVSAHVSELIERGARAHKLGLRAYRATASKDWKGEGCPTQSHLQACN